jgi:hypothetical protein
MSSSTNDIDWGPAEQAARWVQSGRLRDALAALPTLRGAGAIVEDLVIDGDANVVASALVLLQDPDAQIAGRAAYLLGERAVRRGSAAEMAPGLLDALRAALVSDSPRVLALVAALRECARVGAQDATLEFLAIVRRSALGELQELEQMWAVEALIELGWSAPRIINAVGTLEPDQAERLRTGVEEIEREMQALHQALTP